MSVVHLNYFLLKQITTIFFQELRSLEAELDSKRKEHRVKEERLRQREAQVDWYLRIFLSKP